MAHHDRPLDPESLQGLVEQLRLLRRRPDSAARTGAVPEARAVERDDPMSLGREVEDAADLPVLDHGAVAVEKHNRRAIAPLQIVEPNTVNLEKASSRRMVSLRPVRAGTREERRAAQRDRGHGRAQGHAWPTTR